MPGAVNPTSRKYRSPLRAAQAEQTRRAVLDAASGLFVTKGWSGTTIAAIATAASVSNETVYSVFGNKRTILRDLVSDAVRGSSVDVPLLERSEPAQIAAETDQRRQIAIFAQHIASVLSRVAPVMAVVRAAAETDPEMAELYAELHRGRRKNLSMLSNALVRNGRLRARMESEAATATVWRLTSPELFLLMRDIEGMDGKHYATWLEDSLATLLLA